MIFIKKRGREIAACGLCTESRGLGGTFAISDGRGHLGAVDRKLKFSQVGSTGIAHVNVQQAGAFLPLETGFARIPVNQGGTAKTKPLSSLMALQHCCD
ncbi:hypothetical protein [Paenibacillus glycanilyticus]|uniref:hypothetical protein n=1 Tax=Paenibacillus glycanilyticus TaxID=126569 RepID=UPI00190FE7FC|nr:hypothetical protein [Paenibacillus glycanilyticus]